MRNLPSRTFNVFFMKAAVSRKSDHRMETIQYTRRALRRIVGGGDIDTAVPYHF